MFKENQLVMYGATGVCRVEKIGRPEFSADGEDQIYYFLKPVYQNGMIYAPVDNENISIRPIISKEEATRLLDDIDDIEGKVYKSGSMQQLAQHYQNIIDSHDAEDLLGLAKSIYIKKLQAQRANKKLGQIDNRFMKRVEDLLFGEFAAALGTEREKIEEYVHKKLEA